MKRKGANQHTKAAARRALLDPLGDAFYDFVHAVRWRLEAMTDAQLADVVAECDSLTARNCRWPVYDAREVAKQEAEALLRRRERQEKGWDQ